MASHSIESQSANGFIARITYCDMTQPPAAYTGLISSN